MEEFTQSPTLEGFQRCSRDNLLLIVDHYKAAVSRQTRKQTIRRSCISPWWIKVFVPQLQSTPKTPKWSSDIIDHTVRLKELEDELASVFKRNRTDAFERS